MSRYEDLTQKQKKLYDQLKDEIKSKQDITLTLAKIKEEGILKEVLTTANITEKSSGGTEYNLTLLGYAMNFNNFKETIKVILEEIEDKEKVLTTANITEKLPGGVEYKLTPLACAMNFNNFKETIKVILEEIEDKEKVLTTANITTNLPGGVECNLTLLGYAMAFNNFEKIIKVILEEIEDKEKVLTTANITTNLPGGVEYKLTPLGYAMAFNNFEKIIKVILEEIEDKEKVLTTANITEKLPSGVEYKLTPLACAMNFNNFEKTIKVILEEIEDKEKVLTTANITTNLPGGTKYNLTLLGYAMAFSNCEKKIKVILEASEDNNMLEEVFARVEGNNRQRLQEILKTLKSQEQDEGQETKIDNWLARLANSMSNCESNEKPLVSESSVPRTEENIVKTTNKSIMIGSVCGVVAALAVGGGCFAAGVALPILTLIGIAIAAFVLTGLVTGGITYEVCKPCNELNEVDLQSEISSKSSVTV
uniref:magnesium transporter n=1 Tax=Wolbachia endosymbiont (group B) of Pilophorus perplexus TaxID=3066160 RepID=UPI00333EAF8C